MKLYRCSATKNTFFFIEEKELLSEIPFHQWNIKQRTEWIQKICRQCGSGADGLVIVKIPSQKEFDFEWEFYNQDGSSADMCGNASRCMAFFVREKMNFSKSEVVFNTLAGPILVKYLVGDFFSVRMTSHQLHKLWAKEKIDGKEISYCFIDSGVPHAVIEVQSLEEKSLLTLVKNFRFKKEFGDEGANVSFFCKGKDSSYEGVTFERGVEGFTASCGTGAVAMALAVFHRTPPVENGMKSLTIKTPGGELQVEWHSPDSFCWLLGPAQLDEIVETY